MFKVLIVDDKQSKIRDVLSALTESGKINVDKNVDIVTDAKNGKLLLKSNYYDLLVVDINLPLRADTEANPSVGIQLINEVNASNAYKKPCFVIALTEYEELIDKYNAEFINKMISAVLYDPMTDAWKKALLKQVDQIIEHKKNLLESISAPNGYRFDIAVITALNDPELVHVLKLDADWTKRWFQDDTTIYYEGIFRNEFKSLQVAAASSHQMGMPASATLAMKLIEHYRPRYLVMIGISAGVKGKCELGDIVVADQSWDYGSGKIKREGKSVKFEPDPRAIPLALEIKEKVLVAQREERYLKEAMQEWPDSTMECNSKIHVGPVASGAAVLQDESLIKEMLLHNRKLVGIEMEIYGVFFAAANCHGPKPTALAIKGVCDFGDNEKDDRFQALGSYLASKFFYRFALDEL